MCDNKPFEMSVEGRVFAIDNSTDIDDYSTVVSGEFAGWVSLSSKSFEMTDEEIFALLNVADAEKPFALDFLELHNQKTGSLQKIGIEQDQKLYCADDMSVRCYIVENYLEEVIGDIEGGEKLLNSLERYDDNITIVPRL